MRNSKCVLSGAAAEFGMPDGTGRRGIVDEFEQASVAGEGAALFCLCTSHEQYLLQEQRPPKE